MFVSPLTTASAFSGYSTHLGYFLALSSFMVTEKEGRLWSPSPTPIFISRAWPEPFDLAYAPFPFGAGYGIQGPRRELPLPWADGS